MGHRKPTPEPILIKRQEELDDLCARCRAEGRFAFDTEFVMEDRYETEVCLIQIATEKSVAIVDPFLDLDVRGIWDLACDDQVETVVHAGQEDLALCLQHSGKLPRNVFDVQIAAGLAGHDYPLSLQKLLQATMHIRLHKSKTLTDWRKRPLTPEQIRYAAEDVCHLLHVRHKLHDRLARLNRIEWAREEFARFEDESLYRRAEEDKLTHLKGSGALKGRQLAIVHEILLWREALAKGYNRPPRAVLRDHLLVEIARLELASFQAIRDLRGLNLSDKNVRALADVVRRAVEIPSDQWPVSRPRETDTPPEAALIALATAVLRSFCLENDVAYGLVASKRSIRELIRYRAGSGHTDSTAKPLSTAAPPLTFRESQSDSRRASPVRNVKGKASSEPGGRSSADGVVLLQGWRGGSAGALLDDVLAGRRAIRVVTARGAAAMRVEEPNDEVRS